MKTLSFVVTPLATVTTLLLGSMSASAAILEISGPANTWDATVATESASTPLGSGAQIGNTFVRYSTSDTAAVLIGFDLPAPGVDETVTSAAMTLNYFANTGGTGTSTPTIQVSLHRMLTPWVETQATWNSSSTGNAWSGGNVLAQSSGTPIHYDTQVLATASMERSDYGLVSFSSNELTATIADMMEGDLANHGFVIRASGGTQNTWRYLFMSSDRTGVDAILPVLTITTEVPEPSSMALIAAGVTMLLSRRERWALSS